MTLGAIRWSLRSNDVAGMQTNLAWETLLDLPATKPGPLHMRLAAAIRTAIRDGRIPREAALPPSRTLAADLRVSRWTVTEAYAQLVTEGYLTARTGSATRVSWASLAGLDEAADLPVRPPEAVPDRPPRFDLSSARPDLRAFPAANGSRRSGPPPRPRRSISWTTPSGGHPRLRAVLAERLNRSRGAAGHRPRSPCSPARVRACPRSRTPFWRTARWRSAWRSRPLTALAGRADRGPGTGRAASQRRRPRGR